VCVAVRGYIHTYNQTYIVVAIATLQNIHIWIIVICIRLGSVRLG